MLIKAAKSWLPVCAVALLGGGCLFYATDGLRAFTEESARRLHVARDKPLLPAFRLQDMNGKTFALTAPGKKTRTTRLVGFIYTSCPTICQVAGDDFANLRNRLEQLELDTGVKLISLSFDPERDEPEQMRGYAGRHGADGTVWTVARPAASEVAKLTKTFGIRIIPDEWGGFQHNAAIHLIDRQGRLSGVFDMDDIDGIVTALGGAS